MADLPKERLTAAPPFTYVGIDVFGPWLVKDRRTRGGQANAKRWTVIFTCMVVRGVHIEVIESMDASCFINALRRFFATRGPAKQLRSDCGTNFIGASNEIERLSNKEVDCVKRYLLGHGCEWVFNPPHASHMGGAWERMIGVARRVLDATLRNVSPSQLTSEVLTTLMTEIAAFINSRPLLPDCHTPEMPLNMSPSMLLTMKASPVMAPEGPFNQNDLLRSQWRRVQFLADLFWSKWRKDYLPLLQSKSKWQKPNRNLREGDVVLVKHIESPRNCWPFGRIKDVETSSDGYVRKGVVEILQNGTKKAISRPISELVLLVPNEL